MRVRINIGLRWRGVLRAWNTAGLGVFLCALLVAPMNADAESVAGGPLSIEDLSTRSSVVVIGRVISVASDWNSTRTMIFTRIELGVEEPLKGSVQNGRLSFYQAGGQVGDIASEVAGSPVFAEGERLLLFLSSGGDGRLGVVGLFQGKFSIERDSPSGQNMATRRIPGTAQILDRMSLEQAKKLVGTSLGK